MKLTKLGKVSGRKSFNLGNSTLVKKAPKGSLIGEGEIKVKVFRGPRGGVKIQLPKGSKIKMTKGKYMVDVKSIKKHMKGKAYVE